MSKRLRGRAPRGRRAWWKAADWSSGAQGRSSKPTIAKSSGHAQPGLGDGFEHADGNEIIHAEGGGKTGILGKYGGRAFMRLAAGAAMKGQRTRDGLRRRRPRQSPPRNPARARGSCGGGSRSDAGSGDGRPSVSRRGRLIGAEEISRRNAIELHPADRCR